MLRKGLLLVATVAALFSSLGCAGEDGLKSGLTDGVSAAIAALIQTPVTVWLENTFK